MALNDAAITIMQFDERTAACVCVPGGAHGIDERPVTLHTVCTGGLASLCEQAERAPDPCYSILPRHEATLRILTLPTQNAVEIEAMVALSAAEFVPYPIEEMVVTHQSLALLPGGESRVLVVLVRHTTLDEHLKALMAVGREPTQIFLSTACLVATAATLTDDGDVALLHIDPASLELAVVRDDELQFSRGIVQNTRWDLDDPHSREALAYEVRDVLAAYRREREDGLGAEVIHVSATGLPAADIAQLLADRTGKEFRVANTGTTLSADGLPCPAMFTGAARLIRDEGPLRLFLAPPGLAKDRVMKGLQAQVLRGTALAATVLFALLLWFGQAVWQRSNLIAELQTQIDAVAPSAQGIAAKQHGLQIISHQVDRGGSFLELLAGLARSAPPADLNITRIQFDRNAGINLWGRAMTKDLVLRDFLGDMRENATGNLALFAQAHSLYETVGTERNQSVYNYQIAIPLPEEDVDADATRPR